MDGLDLGGDAENVLVDAGAQFPDLGIRLVLPGGIGAGPGALGAGQACQDLHPAGKVLPDRIDAAPDHDDQLDGLARLLEHAEVQAAFHETFQVPAHGLDPIGGDHEQVDELVRGSAVQLALGLVASDHDHAEVRIRAGEFLFQVLGQAIHDGFDLREDLSLRRDGRLRFPGDRIGFRASRQRDDGERPRCPGGIQDLAQKLDPVRPLLDDLQPRMPTLQARDLDVQRAARSRLPSGGELAYDTNSARAADKEHAFFLGIDIQHRLSGEMVGLEGMGPVHAGLFTGGDEHFQRRMGDVLAVQEGQSTCHGDAVVPAEGGAVRPQEVSFDLQDQRVLGKIVLGPLDLLADHVHVSLDDHGG